MSYWRGRLILDIPIAVYESIPSDKRIAFRDECLAMQAYAEKINDGRPNEEKTVLVEWESGTEYWQCRLDLAIPWDVWEGISSAKKQDFKNEVLYMKAYAVEHDGAMVKASWHVCLHDGGCSCDEENEI